MKNKSIFSIILMPVFVLYLCSCSMPDRDARNANEPVSNTSVEDPLVAELLGDLAVVEEKLAALAAAFSEAQYDWRPTDGVRSSAEVFMHVAAINFAFPIFAGQKAPASTGMTMDNLSSAAPAYESSLTSKESIRPELSASFENLRTAIESSLAKDLDGEVTVFGESVPLRAFWVGHLNHLHEHLGQMIAYGRVNEVVPSWSE